MWIRINRMRIRINHIWSMRNRIQIQFRILYCWFNSWFILYFITPDPELHSEYGSKWMRIRPDPHSTSLSAIQLMLLVLIIHKNNVMIGTIYLFLDWNHKFARPSWETEGTKQIFIGSIQVYQGKVLILQSVAALIVFVKNK